VHCAYLDDGSDERIPDSMVLFFGAVSRDIHVMRQNPQAFCAELARRWKLRHPDPGPSAKAILPPADLEMKHGAVFISYAREDESAAARLVQGLQARGVVVWYDRERLQAGEHWENTLEDEVKIRCGLFLSVVSETTESTRESYYHRERYWAAARAEHLSPGEEFYLSVIIHDTPIPPAREPRVSQRTQAVSLPDGEATEDFARRVLALQTKVLVS
jgi:hypothetical protein